VSNGNGNGNGSHVLPRTKSRWPSAPANEPGEKPGRTSPRHRTEPRGVTSISPYERVRQRAKRVVHHIDGGSLVSFYTLALFIIPAKLVLQGVPLDLAPTMLLGLGWVPSGSARS